MRRISQWINISVPPQKEEEDKEEDEEPEAYPFILHNFSLNQMADTALNYAYSTENPVFNHSDDFINESCNYILHHF